MNRKIECLKRFDRIVGGLVCSTVKILVKPKKSKGSLNQSASAGPLFMENTKILVIRPGGIGDAVLLYPALKELRRGFKNAEISVLAEKRNAGILKGCPYISNLFLYDSLPLGLFGVLRGHYDIAIDTEQWHRLSAAISYLTGAPMRVGFATNEREGLFTHPVPYSHDDYEVNSFLNLVSVITEEKYDFNGEEPFIPLDPDLISRIMPPILEFRKRWRAVVGIFPGATVPERRWGISRFAGLSKGLIREGIGTVIVGGRDDLRETERLEEAVGRGSVLSFVGRTSLMETAAVISGVDLFVTCDTGLMHVAYGVGTPTVSLFGAGIQRKWAPIGKHHIALNKGLPCSPCTRFGYTPRCPYGIKCLSDITVDEVKEAVLRLLSMCGK